LKYWTRCFLRKDSSVAERLFRNTIYLTGAKPRHSALQATVGYQKGERIDGHDVCFLIESLKRVSPAANKNFQSTPSATAPTIVWNNAVKRIFPDRSCELFEIGLLLYKPLKPDNWRVLAKQR